MPELPEVETIMRGLAPHIEGHVLIKLSQNRPDLRFPLPDHFAARLEGARLISMRRRAKYMLIGFSNGESLLVHLGMSGRLILTSQEASEARLAQLKLNNRHNHVIFAFDNKMALYYNDPRRFGFMDLVPTDELKTCRFLAQLGVEPLSNQFHGGYLKTIAKGRRTSIKALLLDQKHVAGLGNIYVLEALFETGLHPQMLSEKLANNDGKLASKADELARAIQEVLRLAIEAGGSTIKDYASGDGGEGYFQHQFKVYGREGEPCLRDHCDGEIKRLVQQGRSSFYCSHCQTKN